MVMELPLIGAMPPIAENCEARAGKQSSSVGNEMSYRSFHPYLTCLEKQGIIN